MNSTTLHMGVYLDANTLVYFKNEESPHFVEARTIIERFAAEGEAIMISHLAIDEFLWALLVLFKERRVSKGETWKMIRKALDDILNIPSLCIVAPPEERNKQQEVVGYMEQFSLRPRDAYHLFIMREHRIRRFATFDHDFDSVFKSKLLEQVR